MVPDKTKCGCCRGAWAQDRTTILRQLRAPRVPCVLSEHKKLGSQGHQGLDERWLGSWAESGEEEGRGSTGKGKGLTLQAVQVPTDMA